MSGRIIDTRLFVESDRCALREIYLETRMRTFVWMDRSLFRADDFDRDTEGEIIWVATYATKTVGFISVWETENFIHNLFVHPKLAGQGIGSALLNECLNNIGRPAVLKCLAQNIKARDFYLSKGWRIVSGGDSPDGQYLLMHFDSTTTG